VYAVFKKFSKKIIIIIMGLSFKRIVLIVGILVNIFSCNNIPINIEIGNIKFNELLPGKI